ncbi:MAG: hypothetical protein E6600_16325 [Anaerocolumna aminovalerica]|jgi:hypothetical protein|uniref:hypothetical protein n=1 Tax=Anaerocolumna aminovalerica TaxID=1527 RepID=UPI00248C89D6|nr:hypothetical protein [Anaerocolumna aminovalerica]MDU6266064.1 hypothetical protein [Anaerocolumna aminovalerica]
MSRRLRKIFCLFLSIIFAFGLSATAFAEENNDLSLQSLSIYSDIGIMEVLITILMILIVNFHYLKI